MLNAFFKKTRSRLFEIRPDEGPFLLLIKSTFSRFQKHKIMQTAAGLAYYLLLSFFPFLIFLNAVISGIGIPVSELLEQLSDFLPSQILGIIQSYLSTLSTEYNPGFFLFSFVLAAFSISRSASSLIDSLALSYDTTPKNHLLRNMLSSFVFMILISAFILTLLVVIAAGKAAIIYLGGFGLSDRTLSLYNVLRWWIVAGAIFLFILLVYGVIPYGRKKAYPILPGAIFSFAGVLIVSFALSFYFDNIAQFSVIYGSLGAAVAFMLWLYLMGIIVLTGGEINAVCLQLKKRNRFLDDG